MAGNAGQSGSAGASGGAAGTAGTGATGGTGGAGGTGGTGGYAGTGGYGGTGGGSAGAAGAAIVCGGEVCTDWLCEKSAVGLSFPVYGCCQQTNECGAVNQQDGNLCVPVEVVEQLLDVTCSPD